MKRIWHNIFVRTIALMLFYICLWQSLTFFIFIIHMHFHLMIGQSLEISAMLGFIFGAIMATYIIQHQFKNSKK